MDSLNQRTQNRRQHQRQNQVGEYIGEVPYKNQYGGNNQYDIQCGSLHDKLNKKRVPANARTLQYHAFKYVLFNPS